MKPVSLLGFGAWFALLGVLLGVPGGIMLTWYLSKGWQGGAVIASSLAALVVVRIATALKVHLRKSQRVDP